MKEKQARMASLENNSSRNKYKPTNISLKLIRYWNLSGFSKTRLPATGDKFSKTVIRISKSIERILDETDNKQSDIIKSINNFKLAAFDPNFYPADKAIFKKTTFCNFLYDPYTGTNKFKTYLNPPKKVYKEQELKPKKEIEKLEPVNEAILHFFHMAIKSKMGKENCSPKEENLIVKASNLLYPKIKEWSKKLYVPMSLMNWPRLVIRALGDAVGDVNLGNLSSVWTYDSFMPEYLIKHNYMDEEKVDHSYCYASQEEIDKKIEWTKKIARGWEFMQKRDGISKEDISDEEFHKKIREIENEIMIHKNEDDYEYCQPGEFNLNAYFDNNEDNMPSIKYGNYQSEEDEEDESYDSGL